MVKKVPLRTCVVTKEKCSKGELIRIVKDNTGNIFIDETGKANGRGAYLKRDMDVIKRARIEKQLDHHLEASIPSSVYDELENIISK
ncbi:MAG: YlxR family protein [Bacilli bacterium]|nr:YlxR family protein [Bacilli bacterium]MDD4643416.1 YlxR family protein [Bacilli bacterium]